MKLGSLVSILFESRTAAHLCHLQVTGPGSFAQHKALNAYYKAIIPLADAIAESGIGRFKVAGMEYPRFKLSCEGNGLKMLNQVRSWIDTNRADCGEYSEIQNAIDTVVELLNSTIYLLETLE